MAQPDAAYAAGEGRVLAFGILFLKRGKWDTCAIMRPMYRRAPYKDRRSVGIDSQDCTLWRGQTGRRNEWGEWIAPARTLASTFAVVHVPMARRRDITRGDGARVYDRRKVVAYGDIRGPGASRDSDILYIDGEYWRVIEARRWDSPRSGRQGVVMVEAIIERMDDQTSPATAPAAVGASPIERSFRRYVALGAGLATEGEDGVVSTQAVIPGNGPGPRPAGLHATVLFRTDEQEGFASDIAFSPEQVDAGLDRRITTKRRSGISLQFFGPGSFDAAREFLAWTNTDQAKEEEECREFVLRLALEQTRADGMSSDQWEQRAIVDIQIEYLHTTDQETPTLLDARIDFDTSEGLSDYIDLET